MTISHHEMWIKVAYLDQESHIRFTLDFQELMLELPADVARELAL
ncbi:MAG: hypothetical protein ACRDIB_12680 [Ardenticatenaceae bacterium]